LLRDELLKARAAGACSDIQLPVDSTMVELSVTATRSADGRAGVAVPVVGVQPDGGERQRGSGQKVTVVSGGPVCHDGHPAKVAAASDVLPG
jgi:hypothetical protein